MCVINLPTVAHYVRSYFDIAGTFLQHVIQDIRVSSIKEPEIWKIYRRLSRSQGPARAKKSSHQCSFGT